MAGDPRASAVADMYAQTRNAAGKETFISSKCPVHFRDGMEQDFKPGRHEKALQKLH